MTDHRYDHPELGEFEVDHETGALNRVLDVDLGAGPEPIFLQLADQEEAVTPAQADLATRLVRGLLADSWPQVRTQSIEPPSDVSTVWEFEARRAKTYVHVIDGHRWTVSVFLDGADGEPPDTYNDLPMSFDFTQPES